MAVDDTSLVTLDFSGIPIPPNEVRIGPLLGCDAGWPVVAESGRAQRPSGAACAKRRSIGQMQISAELESVGEASGKLRLFRTS